MGVRQLRGSPPPGIFLDKVCVPQHDSERKVLAIHSFGAFVQRSDRMLVLWDATYFSRLWCVFEVAVFLSLSKGGLIFYPSAFHSYEVAFLFCNAAWIPITMLALSAGVLPYMFAYTLPLGLSPLMTLAILF